MSNIIVTVGISGSGKSTWAANWQKEKKDRVIISRDKIRELLFGYNESNISDYYNLSNFSSCEKIVSEYFDKLVDYSLVQGKEVCLDNTHLNSKYLDEIKLKYAKYPIKFEFFPCSVEHAIDRMRHRTRKVETKVIIKQFNEFQKLGNYDFNHTPTSKVVVQNYNLPFCYIFDIDGTLSDSSHRYIFSDKYDEILADKPIQPVLDVLKSLKSNSKIIFLSGRDGKYENVTYTWIKQILGITDFELYTRAKDDMRNDSIIKEELFKKHILPRYCTIAVFDDRLRITKMWNDLGIFVFNVNQNLKEY